jgi:Lon protease-like protein
MTQHAEIPFFPLNTVLFPGGQLPLRIFEPRYVDMVRNCLRERRSFGVVLIRAGSEVGAVADVAEIGTSAHIADFYQLPDGLLGIACVGERKFRVQRRWVQDDGLNRAEIEWIPEESSVEVPGEYQHLSQLLRRVLPELGDFYRSVTKRFDDATWVGYRLSEILPIALQDKQQCLEIDDPVARLARLSPLIRRVDD